MEKIWESGELLAEAFRKRGVGTKISRSRNRMGGLSVYVQPAGWRQRFRISDHACNPDYRVSEVDLPPLANQAAAEAEADRLICMREDAVRRARMQRAQEIRIVRRLRDHVSALTPDERADEIARIMPSINNYGPRKRREIRKDIMSGGRRGLMDINPDEIAKNMAE